MTNKLDYNHYRQIEVKEEDSIEDVAKELELCSPATCVYRGIEITSERGTKAENIVSKFLAHKKK